MAKRKTKRMAKRKTKSIAKLVDKAAEDLQLLVRLKAADDNGYVSCVVCGVTRHYLDGMQGGHFISRAKLATKLMVENVHPECRGCNMPGGGHEAGWTLYMLETYGKEFVEELHCISRGTKKYYRDEVLAIADDFKQQIKEHEARVAGML
jgi:hypothetical protein